MRAADCRIGVENHHFVEERVDGGAQCGNEHKSFGVFPPLAEFGDLWRQGARRFKELPGFRCERNRGMSLDCESFFFCLAKDVLDAFERGGDCREVVGAADGGDGFGPGHGVAYIVGARGENGVTLVASTLR